MSQADMFDKLSVYRASSSSVVLQDLFALHFPDVSLVLDVTYGKGVFWRGWAQPFSIHATDLDPEKNAIADSLKNPSLIPLLPMNARDLHIQDNTYDVGVFDPPFLARYTSKTGAHMDKKYGTLTSQQEILALYKDGIQELVRVCTRGMIVKCKPGISSSRYWPIRYFVTQYGSEACGRFPEDVAVFEPLAPVIIGDWENQQHLRRTESYFVLWNFRRGMKWTQDK